MSDKLYAFRQSFARVLQQHRCELAYLEQLYDSTVEKLFCDILPKWRLLHPLTDEKYIGTYLKVIRDGYIPEYFIKGSLSEEVFVNEVSRVLRNHPLNWTKAGLNAKYVQDFTFNSVTFMQAILAAKDKDNKVGVERPEVGSLCLADSICEEMLSPREVVIRLTYIFYAVLGEEHELYYHGKSVPLVTLKDTELADKIANFCSKKKYEYDACFLFTKKLDNLFKDELMTMVDLITPEKETAGKAAVKSNPGSDEAIKYSTDRLFVDTVNAAVQFFKINVIAFFVDVADGKPVTDAFEKLMVMIACIAAILRFKEKRA